MLPELASVKTLLARSSNPLTWACESPESVWRLDRPLKSVAETAVAVNVSTGCVRSPFMD